MRPGRPSRTAQHNALFRALEQRLPAPLFRDPWAQRFLRGRYRLVSLLPARAVARAIDRRWPGPRAAVAVRTRYIDEAVGRALAAGLEQVVILGAGFDSRAYRTPGMESSQVFEVDHPDTQGAKRRRLAGAAPAHVHFVPLRFGEGSLESALAAAGFWRGARTLFLWEGVTNYLDEATVDATLRFVAAAGGSILFTYVDARILDGSATFDGASESIAYVRSLGEPFTFGLDPTGLRVYLEMRGLELLEDRALSDVARSYYGERCPPTSAYYHVVDARCRG
jgi:methyltransferase (TIGR00027 family)